MKTDEELKTLAMDILQGRVFTSSQVPEGYADLLPQIFMPLMFMEEEQREAFLKEEPYLLYAPMKEAFPTGVNGFPMFGSMAYLTKEDTIKVDKYIQAYNEAIAAVEIEDEDS